MGGGLGYPASASRDYPHPSQALMQSPSYGYSHGHAASTSSLHPHSSYPPPHPPTHVHSYSFPSPSSATSLLFSSHNRPPSRPVAHSIPRHVRSLNQTQLLDCDIHLQRHYPSLLDLYTDEQSGLEHSFEFTIKHGLMPVLAVRYIRDGSVDELVKPHVDWMMEDLDRHLPVLGVDAETGVHSTRLLQISTRSRCLLVRIPLQSHTHLYSTHHSSHHHHHHTVRVASSITALLESRSIYKSGAELWGDALDLHRDLHLSLNCALNMSWCHRRGHFSLSLEHMTNLVLGKDAFVKDKDTTLSDWDRPFLTFRQLVYGALDAQASFIVANSSEETGPRPLPFHCSDMSGTWLSSAASWLNIVKYVQKEHDAVRSEVHIEQATFVGDELVVRLKAFSARLRWEKWIIMLYADSSEQLLRIDRINNAHIHLSHVRRDASRRVRTEGECVKLIVLKEKADEAIMTPVRQYLSRAMHGEEPFNPFIASILDLPFIPRPSSFTSSSSAAFSSSTSSLLSPYALPQRLLSPPHSPSLSPTFSMHDDPHFVAVPTAPQPWWFDDHISSKPLSVSTPSSSSSSSSSSSPSASSPTSSPPHPPLCGEQKDALTLLSNTRILAITGGPGSGKSQLLAAAILLTPPEHRSLIITETPSSARHLCTMLAPYLDADELALFVPLEFIAEWEEGEYEVVRDGGYLVDVGEGGWPMEDEEGAGGGRRRVNRRVMVTTVSMAFSLMHNAPSLLFPRPLLCFDDANQVWLVKALLLLRFLTSTERLLATGDLVGLTPSLCKDIHHPLSLLSQLTIVAASHHLHHYHGHRPKAFTILHHQLHTQHRMAKHISSLISTIFYPTSPLLSLDEPTGERNLYWKDCRGAAVRAENSKSVQNLKEAEEVVRVWLQLEREGWKREEMVVLCFYDAQVEAVWENGGAEIGVRVMMVEAFAGRETECVILSLASEFITPSLSDRYRINTACSRGRQRLYIVGNRITLTRVEGHWKAISEFEQREPIKKAQVVPHLLNDFPELGAAAAAPPASSYNDNHTGAINSSAVTAPLTSPTHSAPHVSPPGPAGRVSGGGLAWSSLLSSGSSGGSAGGLTSSSSQSSMTHHDDDDDLPPPSSTPYGRNGQASDAAAMADGATDKWGQNGGLFRKKPATASPSSASSSSSLVSSTQPTMPQQPVATFATSSPASATTRPGLQSGASSFHPSSSPHGPSPSTPHFRPSFPSLAMAGADDPTKVFRWRTSICHFFVKGHCQNGQQCNFAHGEWELRSLQAASAAHQLWQQQQQQQQAIINAQQQQQQAQLWSGAVAGGVGGGGLSMMRSGGLPQSPKQFALPPQPTSFSPFSPSSLSALSLTSPTSSIYSPARSSPSHAGRMGPVGPTFSSLSSPTSSNAFTSSSSSSSSSVFSPSPSSSSSSLFTPQKPSSSLLHATSAVFTPMYNHTPATTGQAAPSNDTQDRVVERRKSNESAGADADDEEPDTIAVDGGRMREDSAERKEAGEVWEAAAAEDGGVWRGVGKASAATVSSATLQLSTPTSPTVSSAAAPPAPVEGGGGRGGSGLVGKVAAVPSLSTLTTSITTSNGHTIKILPSTPAASASASAAPPSQVRKISAGPATSPSSTATTAGAPSAAASSAAAVVSTPTAVSAAAMVAGIKAAGKKPVSTSSTTTATSSNPGSGSASSSVNPASKQKAGKDGKASGEGAKGEKKAMERSGGVPRSDAPSPPPSSGGKVWYCPSCTFLNDALSSRCEMCETERKEDWKPVTTGKKPAAAAQAQQLGTQGGSGVGGGGGVGAGGGGSGGSSAGAGVMVNNPFAAVMMNGQSGGGRRKGR